MEKKWMFYKKEGLETFKIPTEKITRSVSQTINWIESSTFASTQSFNNRFENLERFGRLKKDE